ncbi:Fic family protein [Flavobacterium algicola]|uniref:Fic family protein n=1 Tax=Flavobacterium algicola TaxID=556529 RepID=UPI001EFDAB59|nr:Fic family protein [Flavobacterium algicola]MCG9792905.1 Fic family protein [Flavobacterium algicola]
MTTFIIKMKNLLKIAREQRGIKTRELAQLASIDQALISKFESGARKPTKEQILKLSTLLEINYDTLMVAWLKEKILYEIGDEPLALKAIKEAEDEIKYLRNASTTTISRALQQLLNEIDILKQKRDNLLPSDVAMVRKAIEINYTFESNRLDGNTLTQSETEMVITKGMTISGKSMREHLEAINHQEAIAHLKNLEDKTSLNEKEVLTIHNLILRGINPSVAGSYRKEILVNEANSYSTSAPQEIAKDMEECLIWYEMNKSKLHPVLLAAKIHERLSHIHPFADGNGKTIRLIMNSILVQHGYTIATIKGDDATKANYYKAIEKALATKDDEDFQLFIAEVEKNSLEHYIANVTK